MNKCIAFVDDDERFLEQSREHLTYRGYEFIGWRDSRTAFGRKGGSAMRSKRANEVRALSAIVNREILPGLAISVSVAALSPFVLGYALYGLLAGRGAASARPVRLAVRPRSGRS